MDSLAQQIAAWLAAQGNRPRGPLVPMSAGGVPLSGTAQPAAQPQEFTVGPQEFQGGFFDHLVQRALPGAEYLDRMHERRTLRDRVNAGPAPAMPSAPYRAPMQITGRRG